MASSHANENTTQCIICQCGRDPKSSESSDKQPHICPNCQVGGMLLSWRLSHLFLSFFFITIHSKYMPEMSNLEMSEIHMVELFFFFFFFLRQEKKKKIQPCVFEKIHMANTHGLIVINRF